MRWSFNACKCVPHASSILEYNRQPYYLFPVKNTDNPPCVIRQPWAKLKEIPLNIKNKIGKK